MVVGWLAKATVPTRTLCGLSLAKKLPVCISSATGRRHDRALGELLCQDIVPAGACKNEGWE